jgi:hypothetical protein
MKEMNQAQVDGIAKPFTQNRLKLRTARRHLKSEKRRAKREWPLHFLVAYFGCSHMTVCVCPFTRCQTTIHSSGKRTIIGGKADRKDVKLVLSLKLARCVFLFKILPSQVTSAEISHLYRLKTD